jgi:hypothetical protein
MHLLTNRPPRLAAAVTVAALALLAALAVLPRDRAEATPPSGVAAELLARGTVAHADRVQGAGISLGDVPAAGGRPPLPVVAAGLDLHTGVRL